MDPSLNTTNSVSPPPPTPTTHEKYFKVKRSNQKRKLALGRRLLYNNVHSEGFDAFPRETMENIIHRIDNVDSICLALTNKRNHTMVVGIKKQKLNELVPRAPTRYLYLRKHDHGDDTRPYRRTSFHHLLRRLVVWMPRRNMFHTLMNEACLQTWRYEEVAISTQRCRFKTWGRGVSEDIEWAQGEIEMAIERIDIRRGQRSLKVKAEVKEEELGCQVAQDSTVMPQALEASVLSCEDTEDAMTCPSVGDTTGWAQWLHRMKYFGFFDNVHSSASGPEETRTTSQHVRRGIWGEVIRAQAG